MILIGTVLTIGNYIFYCFSRFCKNKKSMLTFDLFSKAFTIISLACFGSLTGSCNMLISIGILIYTNLRERKIFTPEKNWRYIVILRISAIISCIISILIFRNVVYISHYNQRNKLNIRVVF